MGDEVEKVDYVAGGMVAAAPGGASWYHQHFPTGREGLRLLVFIGGLPGWAYREYVGRRKKTVFFNAEIEEGGTAISYRKEDPHVREEFIGVLSGDGLEFRMPAELYA